MKLTRFWVRLFLFCSLFLGACGTFRVTVDEPTLTPTEAIAAATPSLLPSSATATRTQPTAADATEPVAQSAVFYDANTDFLLGGVVAGRWLLPTDTVDLIEEREQYQLYDGWSKTGQAAGTVETVDSPICSGHSVEFVREPAVSWSLAVAGATWDVTPNPPVATTLSRDQRAALVSLLGKRGLQPEPTALAVEQAQQVDLEGDGSPEIVVSASRLRDEGRMPPVAAGDYALVAVVREDNSVLPVRVDVYPEAETLAYPWHYRLAAILDLNGDGRQELVVAATRYEGRRSYIYEIDEETAMPVLSSGCPPAGVEPTPPEIAEQPTATATRAVVPVPTRPPRPTATPTPDAHIAHFAVAPTSVAPGSTVTVTWEATGVSAQLCLQVPTVNEQIATRACEPVPLSGSRPYPLDPVYRNRVLLALEVDNGEEVANASLPIDLPCPDDWWYLETPPEVCPSTDAFHSLAAAQNFEGGQMIWIEDPGMYYVFFDDGSYQTFYDPLQITEEDVPPVEDPPPGGEAPVSGFGLLWRGQVPASEGLGERLGWALGPEFNFDAVWQVEARPEQARTFLQGPEGQVLLLHSGLNRWERWE